MVTENELRYGDILLQRSSSLIGDLIRKFDDGDYNHVALYIGDGTIEALGEGITTRSLRQSAGSDIVDVFRYRSGGHILGEPGLPIDPVKGRVDYYLANRTRYGHEQLLLLAMLTTLRRLPFVGWASGLGKVLRIILDNALQGIDNILAMGKEPMICSELVYRIFDECGYRITVSGVQWRAAAYGSLAHCNVTCLDPNEEADFRLFSSDCEAFLERYKTAGAAVADFVTPHDLQNSPSLLRIGRLTI